MSCMPAYSCVWDCVWARGLSTYGFSLQDLQMITDGTRGLNGGACKVLRPFKTGTSINRTLYMYSGAVGSVLGNSRCLPELPFIVRAGKPASMCCMQCGVHVVHGETALLGKMPACSRLISSPLTWHISLLRMTLRSARLHCLVKQWRVVLCGARLHLMIVTPWHVKLML